MTTPFVNSNPGYRYSAKGNEVYAIVPSHSGTYAPIVQEAGYGLPSVGRQITIPDGVPGLAAGTYTLMPATYALLPGAYRVELGGSVSPASAGVVPAGNGSHFVSATLSVANTRSARRCRTRSSSRRRSRSARIRPITRWAMTPSC
jgi:hypothetical protein